MFFKKTVDSVLATFTKVVTDLEDLHVFHTAEAEAAKLKQEALALEQEVHQAAVAKIAAVKAKIEQLIGE